MGGSMTATETPTEANGLPDSAICLDFANTVGGSRAEPTVMARLKSISTQAAEDPSWDFIKARVEWLMKDKKDATPDLVACRQAIYSQPGFKQAMANAIKYPNTTVGAALKKAGLEPVRFVRFKVGAVTL